MTAIKYVGYYDHRLNARENRAFALSAAAKMEYITEVLNRLGHEVTIISPSQTRGSHFYGGKVISINSMTRLRLFPTFARGNSVQRVFRWALSASMLFAHLVRNVHRGEIVIVYHSLALQDVVRLAKRIRRFRLVLEVEEVYQDVGEVNSWVKLSEYALFRAADAFIFSTQLLNEKLNAHVGKPHVVLHGTYKTEVAERVGFGDDRIHVVYAGTLDPRKGGAMAAVEAAAHLDASFHIHILGVGTEEQVSLIREKIESIGLSSPCRITYDGILSGSEYTSFLQKCDIGLSTQDPSAAFNDSSFPSKILSYMANGLRVVSINIPAVARSRVASAVVFYDEQRPESIAKAVRKASSAESTSRQIVAALDAEFTASLADLIAHRPRSSD